MPDYRRRATKEAMSLRFDFHGVLLGEGGAEARLVAEINELQNRLGSAHEELSARRRAGELPFLDWVHDREGLALVKDLAEEVRQYAKTLVVVGAGGTALAAQTLVRAAPPGSVRVLFADSIDPDLLGPLLDQLDLTTTVFNVISKSGETPETLAQFLVIRDLLLRHLGGVDYTRHLVVTTDADQGALRQIVHDEGFRSVPIPPGVSDRFAALSPASFFPAAVAGIRVDEVIAGAVWMDTRCQDPDVWHNPALLLAASLYLAHTGHALQHVLFLPFCRQLEPLAQWSSELLVEAVQKSRGNSSVYPAVTWFPHSQRAADPYLMAQLLLERPNDTVAILLSAADHGRELSIAAAYQDLEAVGYLGSKGLGQMLEQSERALEALLRRHGRWHILARWPAVNPFTLGQWVHALEVTTLYLAHLFQVELWAQPAADACRRLLYGALGRKGFEAQGDEVASLVAVRRKEWVL